LISAFHAAALIGAALAILSGLIAFLTLSAGADRREPASRG